DLSALDANSPTLTYTAHGRMEEGGTGLVLGETEQFTLIALCRDHAYTAMLVPTSDCSPLLVTRQPGGGTRYLSSDASLTSYPLFSAALTLETLPRGTEVNVLNEVIPQEGEAFAEVEYEGGRGYV